MNSVRGFDVVLVGLDVEGRQQTRKNVAHLGNNVIQEFDVPTGEGAEEDR